MAQSFALQSHVLCLFLLQWQDRIPVDGKYTACTKRGVLSPAKSYHIFFRRTKPVVYVVPFVMPRGTTLFQLNLTETPLSLGNGRTAERKQWARAVSFCRNHRENYATRLKQILPASHADATRRKPSHGMGWVVEQRWEHRVLLLTIDSFQLYDSLFQPDECSDSGAKILFIWVYFQ